MKKRIRYRLRREKHIDGFFDSIASIDKYFKEEAVRLKKRLDNWRMSEETYDYWIWLLRNAEVFKEEVKLEYIPYKVTI